MVVSAHWKTFFRTFEKIENPNVNDCEDICRILRNIKKNYWFSSKGVQWGNKGLFHEIGPVLQFEKYQKAEGWKPRKRQICWVLNVRHFLGSLKKLRTTICISVRIFSKFIRIFRLELQIFKHGIIIF